MEKYIEKSEYVPIYKYILLNICTFNIYELVWIYRQWDYIKKHKKISISPAKRTFSSPIFYFSLVYHICDLNNFKKFLCFILSIIYGGIYLFTHIYVILSEDYLKLVILFTITLPILVLQNNYLKLIDKNTNYRKTKIWQKTLLGLGLIVNLLTFVGTLLQ